MDGRRDPRNQSEKRAGSAQLRRAGRLGQPPTLAHSGGGSTANVSQPQVGPSSPAKVLIALEFTVEASSRLMNQEAAHRDCLPHYITKPLLWRHISQTVVPHLHSCVPNQGRVLLLSVLPSEPTSLDPQPSDRADTNSINAEHGLAVQNRGHQLRRGINLRRSTPQLRHLTERHMKRPDQ